MFMLVMCLVPLVVSIHLNTRTTIQYPLPKELLGIGAVWLSVWSKTKLSQLFLGESCIPLSSTSLPKTTYKHWQPLEDYSESDISQDTETVISSHESSPHQAEKEFDLQQAVEQGSHVHPRPVDFLLTEGARSPHPEKNTANVDEDEASAIHPAVKSIFHPHTEGNNPVEILKAERKSLNESKMDSLVKNITGEKQQYRTNSARAAQNRGRFLGQERTKITR